MVRKTSIHYALIHHPARPCKRCIARGFPPEQCVDAESKKRGRKKTESTDDKTIINKKRSSSGAELSPTTEKISSPNHPGSNRERSTSIPPPQLTQPSTDTRFCGESVFRGESHRFRQSHQPVWHQRPRRKGRRFSLADGPDGPRILQRHILLSLRLRRSTRLHTSIYIRPIQPIKRWKCPLGRTLTLFSFEYQQ